MTKSAMSPPTMTMAKLREATNPHDLLDQESVKLQLTPHFKSLEAFIPKVGTSKNTQESAVLLGGVKTPSDVLIPNRPPLSGCYSAG
jgi:hypothetical protein